MKKIAWIAVIVGGVVDMILTNLFTIPIGIYVVATAGLARLPQNQVTAGYLAALHANPVLYAGALFCGCLASFCAGMLAGLMAKHDRVLNGGLSAWACVAIDVYGFATHTSGDGLLLQVALLPAAPLLGALGGYAVSRMRRKKVVPIAI